MPDPILARATAPQPTPPAEGGLDDILAALFAMEERLSATERLPLARDGRDGAPGRDGKDGLRGERGEPGPRGEVGSQGPQGLPGKDGVSGTPGVSVSGASVESDGTLQLLLSNGEIISAGMVVGPRGEAGPKGEAGRDGKDGEPGIQGEKGERGEAGQDGAPGRDGVDGIGLADAAVSPNGEFSLTLTDGRILVLGNIRGPQGAKGEAGQDGAPGERGEQGPAAVIDEAMVSRIAAEIIERQMGYAVTAAMVEAEARLAARIDAMSARIDSLVITKEPPAAPQQKAARK